MSDLTEKQEKALSELFGKEFAAVILAYGRAVQHGKTLAWLEEFIGTEIIEFWGEIKSEIPEADFRDRLILEEFCQNGASRDTQTGCWDSNHPEILER
jgi:hypothetical protein